MSGEKTVSGTDEIGGALLDGFEPEKTLKQIIDDSEEILKKKIKWFNKKKKKSTTCPNPKDLWLCYLEANALQDYLDDTLGAENWQDRYCQVKDTLFCELGILWEGRWIWKSNAGAPSNIEKEKGEATDAFKRACYKWGFGRFMYDDARKPVKKINNFEENILNGEDKIKATIADGIMAFQDELPDEVSEALNYIAGQGYQSLNECSEKILNAIIKRLQILKKEKELNLTDGFSK